MAVCAERLNPPPPLGVHGVLDKALGFLSFARSQNSKPQFLISRIPGLESLQGTRRGLPLLTSPGPPPIPPGGSKKCVLEPARSQKSDLLRVHFWNPFLDPLFRTLGRPRWDPKSFKCDFPVFGSPILVPILYPFSGSKTGPKTERKNEPKSYGF